jgi:hypothetical protein
MAKRNYHKDIDDILRHWPFTGDEIRVRTVKAADGREVLQMRVELGVLQLETERRPDGQRPEGFDTYLDYLLAEELEKGGEFALSEEQCHEVDREFMQFYQRRVCWLQTNEFARAVRDADHTLRLMDFVKRHSPNEDWTLSHEQYRPFVLFHRTYAAAQALLDRPEGGAEAAVGEINDGLQRMQQFIESQEQFSEVDFDDLEMVQQLKELRESLRDKHDLGQTLSEQLNDAVAREEYELAAKLRDEIRRRQLKRAPADARARKSVDPGDHL